jgi:ATP-dependent DNA helicase PIF1
LSSAVEAGDGGVYFLDGYGGTGKTFTINLTLAQARANGHIAIAVASSGIAAVLLDGGTTAHSRFKIPIEIHAESTCNIPAQGHLAELIREAKLVFWDEAPMQHRHCMEAVDRTFRDIRNDPRPFGGVVFCFCGDFRQILQAVPKGS